MLTKEAVVPNDFEVEDHLFGSPFQNCEKEIIARNVIILSQWNDNKWLDFTWEEYEEKCEHRVTLSERSILNGFVQEGLLSCHEGVYSVQNYFIQKFEKFVKK